MVAFEGYHYTVDHRGYRRANLVYTQMLYARRLTKLKPLSRVVLGSAFLFTVGVIFQVVADRDVRYFSHLFCCRVCCPFLACLLTCDVNCVALQSVETYLTRCKYEYIVSFREFVSGRR